MHVLFAELVQLMCAPATPQVGRKQCACRTLIRGFENDPANVLSGSAAPIEAVEKLLAVAKYAVEFWDAILRSMREGDEEARHWKRFLSITTVGGIQHNHREHWRHQSYVSMLNTSYSFRRPRPPRAESSIRKAMPATCAPSSSTSLAA